MNNETMNDTSTRRSRVSAGAGVMLALALGVVPGCRDDEEVDELESLELQPTQRFALGATFYLPTPDAEQWVLASAPEGNANVVVAGADGYARFTPVVAGAYEFAVPGSELRRSLVVVSDAPYEHFNYYPTSSMAMVSSELWVANVFDPHLSRVDPQGGGVLGTIPVGPWPTAVAHVPGADVALVAHKAGDTLGFVDVAQGRLIDAVWVGDEPAAIVLTSDGARAFVSLATEDAVVVVDVATREVVGRVATNINPTSMALSADDGTLYVASYRSAVSSRQQYGNDPRNDEFDIAVVDTDALEVTGYIGDAGATIGGLLIDGDRLYVATTRVAVEELTNQEGMTAFRHTVAAYDTSSLSEVAAADLGRQDSSGGWAVRPFGMAMAGGTLWVANEGSDLVLGLDPSTLAETTRMVAEGRPRTVLAADDQLFVHGPQSYRVTMAGVDGTVTGTAQLSGDPRGEAMAAGQWLYTGTGAGAGINHSCADCHVDGLTDGNLWEAGFASSVSRPMFWLEGTAPIGWEGDAQELFSYLYGSPGPTIGATVTTELIDVFYAYLSSLVPPPPANGMTRRDGSFTEDALRGEALFNGKGACSGCHAGPLKTEGLRLPGGGTQTDHPIVVPSLIGSYRHTFWLVDGAARTLEEAVAAMLPLSGSSLDEGEIGDVARYLGELTAREFFVLSTTPSDGDEHVRSEGPITIVMSHPVFDDAENLGRIAVRNESGALLDFTLTVEGRHLTLDPSAPLAAGERYTIELDAQFEAFSERVLEADTVVSFTVAQAPALRLEGDYVVTVDHPTLDFAASAYDNSVTLPIDLPMTAGPTGYGAVMVGPVTDVLDGEYDVVVEGDIAYFPPFAFAVPAGSMFFLNRSFPSEIVLVDEDGDGVADSGQSTLMFRSPGLEATDVRWVIARPGDEMPTECTGQEGMNLVDLMVDGAGNPTVDWSTEVGALGYYVTDPDATAPAGPGPVTGGEAYWALSTAEFP
ncbi:MAG: Ig-like domain-containing protein, partial [Deltaproteobacteria bacterium]|nr:Ig-like domain-containing protein [Deltaproteobacteria bacterium]